MLMWGYNQNLRQKIRSGLAFFILGLFGLGIYLFLTPAIFSQAPPGGGICVSRPDLCPPPPPQSPVVNTFTFTGPSQVRVGDRVSFTIVYDVLRNDGSDFSSCNSGWIRLPVGLPIGFNVTSTTPGVGVPCPGPLVWHNAQLNTNGDGRANDPGTITINVLIDITACQFNPGNVGNSTAAILLREPDNGAVTTTNRTVTTTIICPASVIGNVSSTSGGVSSSTGLIIRAPAGVSPVLTADGLVNITRDPGVITVAPYRIDTSSWQTQLNDITSRLLTEFATQCNFDVALSSVCKTSSANFPSTITGTGTIIYVGNADLTINNIENAKVGIIVTGSNKVNIAATKLRSVALYAPNSTMDFGSDRDLSFGGAFIAKDFANLHGHTGTIEYDSSLAKSPPPGLGQIFATLLTEAIP